MMRQILQITLFAVAATLLSTLFAANSLYAQDGEPVDSLRQSASPDSLIVHEEEVLTEKSEQGTDGQLQINDEQLQVTGEKIVKEEGYVPTKSPWGAALRSALLPGLGQFYNEAYWKIPVVVGVTGVLVYGYIYENKNFKYYSDLYDDSITEEEPNGDLNLKRYREFYRNNRDSYATWIVITYLLQIADAFVDAHLFDFDVSDEVQGSVGLGPGTLNLQLRW